MSLDDIATEAASELWRKFDLVPSEMNDAKSIIRKAIDEAIRIKVRQGCGRRHPCERDGKFGWAELDKFKQWGRESEQYDSLPGSSFFLTEVIEYMEDRIVFLTSDNEAWLDGFRQGMAEMKRRAVSAINEADPTATEKCYDAVYDLSEGP